MNPRLLAIPLASLLLSSCSKSDGGTRVGHPVVYTPPAEPDPSTLPLPKKADGSLILSQSSAVEVDWAPPTKGPITALAQCTTWIVGCVSPDRHLDDCARSVPTCKTDAPWNEEACCPSACFERYAAKRTSGVAEIDAFAAVYFDENDSCVAGVTAALKGQP